MTEPKKSPIWQQQDSMGATFMELWGWLWTASFGDVDREYAAIRTGAGVSDLTPIQKWEFSGPDAFEALDRIHSNDLTSLAEEQARYGALVDEAGAMVDDALVYRLSDDLWWLLTNSALLTGYFDQTVGHLDCRVEDFTDAFAVISIQGPESFGLLSKLAQDDLSRLGYFRFTRERVRVAGTPVHVSRTGFSGELGYELFVEPDAAPGLWDAVLEAGGTPYGATASEKQRIESGIVVHEFDYEPRVASPYDVSMDRLVVPGKPGLIGGPALEKFAASPPNRLATLRIDGEDVPPYGCVVSSGGEEVGWMTSPTRSDTFGLIGLATVRADIGLGDPVDVIVDGDARRASVDGPSLYDPSKSRRRVDVGIR